MHPILKNHSLLRDRAYIGGEWITAADKKTFSVTNPYDNSHLLYVPDMGAQEARQAIEAAHAALPAWRARTGEERAAILKKFHALIIANLTDLAYILTLEQGKPLAEAKGEIRYGASFVEWFAEESRRVYGDIVPSHGRDKRILTTKQAIGVVAAITPWNFPNAMITRKIAPALAAGCTIVLKPAEDTPLSALALAVLMEEAGVPPGVINIVTTSQAVPVGQELTSNALVRKLSFTGSTATGKLLMAQCASTVKKISLELGGNAPFIVFDDADLDAAVEGAMNAKYRNAGQTCISANRILVQAGVHDAFVEKMQSALSKQVMGSGLEQGTTVGPLINKKAIDKVERLVNDAIAKGAQASGKINRVNGNFYEPTILTGIDETMEISHEEIFGPIAPVFKFTSEEEAIRIANDTPYGLAAYFYGRDHAQIWRVAEALEYGMVGINTGMISTAQAPFGGMKESGIGREGSRYGIDEYLEIKYLCWGGLDR